MGGGQSGRRSALCWGPQAQFGTQQLHASAEARPHTVLLGARSQAEPPGECPPCRGVGDQPRPTDLRPFWWEEQRGHSTEGRH